MNYEIAHLEMFSHAMDFYGMKEIPGKENNPQIVEFFNEIGFEWVQDDEVAWCSAFINYLALKCGYERSGQLNARSWMKAGIPVINPTVGDIVVFWRIHPTEAWQGHVGMFVRKDGNNIYTLGGNQDNQVCIKAYPEQSNSFGLLGYRMLNRVKK